MAVQQLRPFWNYYGGKWKHGLQSDAYPAPRYSTIIEPFAGAAGYSIRHYRRDVIIVEKDPRVSETWKFLLNATPNDILSLPIVTDVDDLPEDIPIGAKYLIGFNMNTGIATPAKTLSASHRNNRILRNYSSGWSIEHRELCAWQASYIKHWQLIQGDYSLAPNALEATWFIDPPYNNQAGAQYRMHDLDYDALGKWCRERKGQTIVCENKGATWLPFEDRLSFMPSINKKSKMREERSQEVVWYNPPEIRPPGFFV